MTDTQPDLKILQEAFDDLHDKILRLDSELRLMNEKRSIMYDRMSEISFELTRMKKEA